MKWDPNHRDFDIALSHGVFQVWQEPIQGAVFYQRSIYYNQQRKDKPRHMNRAVNALDTHVHEVIHVSMPELEEREVRRLAKDITLVLRRLGYRRLANRPPCPASSRSRRSPPRRTRAG